jgi:hypothetical protein
MHSCGEYSDKRLQLPQILGQLGEKEFFSLAGRKYRGCCRRRCCGRRWRCGRRCPRRPGAITPGQPGGGGSIEVVGPRGGGQPGPRVSSPGGNVAVQRVEAQVRHAVGEPVVRDLTRNSQGWARFWPNFRTSIEIFIKTAVPTCELWANPVNFVPPARRARAAGAPWSARQTSRSRAWMTPAQPRGPSVYSLHQIACILNHWEVGIEILRNRQAKGAGRPPGPPELAALPRAAPRRARTRRAPAGAWPPQRWRRTLRGSPGTRGRLCAAGARRPPPAPPARTRAALGPAAGHLRPAVAAAAHHAPLASCCSKYFSSGVYKKYIYIRCAGAWPGRGHQRGPPGGPVSAGPPAAARRRLCRPRPRAPAAGGATTRNTITYSAVRGVLSQSGPHRGPIQAYLVLYKIYFHSYFCHIFRRNFAENGPQDLKMV